MKRTCYQFTRRYCPPFTVLASSVVVLMTAILAPPAFGQHSGIQGKIAPELKVDSWANLQKKSTKFRLKDHKGKVVFLYCFQAHCSGCRASGFPRMKRLYAKYREDKQIQFVAIQTTFGSDTFDQAKKQATNNATKQPTRTS